MGSEKPPPLSKAPSGSELPTGAKAKKRKNRKKKTAAQKEAAAEQPPPPESDEADSGSDEDEGKDGYRRGGYHPVRIGDVFNRRYKVIKKLGWGHFSTVWLCRDNATGGLVALKIQKSEKAYTEAARDEIELLNCLDENNGPHKSRCVALLDQFQHAGPHGRHVCMVFEVMGENLLSLIKRYDYRGIPINIVRSISRQVLEGLDHVHRCCSMIHTDLKPENVLLQSPPESILLADLPAEGTPCTPRPANEKLSKNARKKVKKKLKKEKQKQEAEALAKPEADADTVTNDITEGTEALTINSQHSTVENSGAVGETSGAKMNSPAATQPPRASGSAAPVPPLPALPTPSPALAEDVPTSTDASTSVADIEGTEGGGRPGEANDDSFWTNFDSQYSVKIVDFGNACWVHKQFSEGIQTRQYRSPEVILRAGYSTSADIFSFACMVFELCTGDLLFEPREGKTYSRDDDHMALFLELMQRDLRLPKGMEGRGKDYDMFFNRNRELRQIKKLRFWPLKDVLEERYKFPVGQATALASFLEPMLSLDPSQRVTAAEALRHPWLYITENFVPASRRKERGGSSASDNGSRSPSRSGSAPSEFD